MKGTDVQAILSLYRGGTTTAQRAESVGIALRAAGMIPKGGRGLHAPELSPSQVAIFALAVAGAETVAECAQIAADLSELADASGRTLLDTLVSFLQRPERTQEIASVLVMPLSSIARIDSHEAAPRYFTLPENWKDPTFMPWSQGQGFAGRVGWIGGGIIQRLAIDMADEAEEVEVVD